MQASRKMTVRTLFRWVVWLGILLNWSFAAWAFVKPANLVETLALGALRETVWLFNYSVLLAILSCFYIPAAKDPLRYRTNAWLMIVGRLVPATTFFVGVFVGSCRPVSRSSVPVTPPSGSRC